jgi:hypothetical protein
MNITGVFGGRDPQVVGDQNLTFTPRPGSGHLGVSAHRGPGTNRNPATFVTPAVQCPIVTYLMAASSTWYGGRNNRRKKSKYWFRQTFGFQRIKGELEDRARARFSALLYGRQLQSLNRLYSIVGRLRWSERRTARQQSNGEKKRWRNT